MMFGSDNLFKFDDIIMLYLLKQIYLSVYPLRISLVLESQEDLLNGEDRFCLFASYFPNMSVSSASYLFYYVVALLYLTLQEIVFATSLLLLLLISVSHQSKNKNRNYNKHGILQKLTNKRAIEIL